MSSSSDERKQAAPPSPPPLPPSEPNKTSTLVLKTSSTPPDWSRQLPPPIDYSSLRAGPYFFYGTLMDPNMLSEILQLDHEPVLRPANVVGYVSKLWGQYPALVQGEMGAVVRGAAYHVETVEDARRLAEYETNHYRRQACEIYYTDGKDPETEHGQLFMFAGNPNDLDYRTTHSSRGDEQIPGASPLAPTALEEALPLETSHHFLHLILSKFLSTRLSCNATHAEKMRAHAALVRPMRSLRMTQPSYICRQCRAIQISAAPSTEAPRGSTVGGAGGDVFGTPIDPVRDMADARFEVLGSPYSMLSVTLSPSQRLYTRRGTLVALAGKPEDTQSTLSVLNPLTRAPLGVPFLYQRISATSPVTALLSTKSPTTTFSVLHLDGTTDWMVTQRNALLAWTGHTLTLSPRMQTSLAPAHWGSTLLTGRGLAAVSAPGQVYQLTLGEGEEFVAHPASVVAYAVSRTAPRPFRFKSSSFRLQVPSVLGRIMPAELAFMKTVRASGVYKFVARMLFGLRTMTRRTIWGDRLFLQFTGPTTLLMSSRGVRIADALSSREVNEIADAPAGAVQEALGSKPVEQQQQEPAFKVAAADGKQNGKVTFEDGKDLKEFVR